MKLTGIHHNKRLASLLTCVLLLLSSLPSFTNAIAAPSLDDTASSLGGSTTLSPPNEPAEGPKKDTQPPDSIIITLKTPPYQFVKSNDGFDLVQIEGFDLSRVPGAPALPRKVYNVAVPPDTALDSLRLKVVDAQVIKLPGTYQIKLPPPDRTATGLEDDLTAYQSSCLPAPGTVSTDSIRLLSPGQMRKWRLARLEFLPFRYDLASGELSVVSELTVRINYDLSLKAQDMALLRDGVMDDVAQQLLVNYDTAQEWYQALGGQGELSASTAHDYVIITTNAIVAGSSKLDDFITHKQSQGHSVLTVTETQYGSLTGQSPNGTAEKIRQWLINNYITDSIEYVLLIGNPDPDDPTLADPVGDVPMKMCWPRCTTSSDDLDECVAPTDYFYADLTGNWNKDGDLYFGEYGAGKDGGTGGVDFAPEVYVGRIPVYSAAYTTLDNILQKIIDYEDEINPMSWRKSALLPMSFLEATYDTASLAEQMKDYYLTAAGYSSWTQYQQGSGACGLDSSYASDEELSGSTVVGDRWAANDYGLVLWSGHGGPDSAAIGYSGCWDGILFSNLQTSSLDDDHPSFVYQASCNNGYPELASNLQYALLKQGAIGTVGATRVSWYNSMIGYGFFENSTTIHGIGYRYVKRLVEGQAAGDALYNAKTSPPPPSATSLMNYYDFNLYGDPSTSILLAAPSNLVATPASQTQINLSWTDNSNNESGFKIEQSPNGTSGWTQIATVGINATTYSNTGLTCNTTYYYRVRAYNAGGDSGYSNTANATTVACIPVAPSGLTAAPASQTQINLSWTDNSNNESGFKIERSPNGTSGWTQIATVGINATTYSNTGLTCNTTYYYRVRAYNAGGDSGYSNTANATTFSNVYLPLIQRNQ